MEKETHENNISTQNLIDATPLAISGEQPKPYLRILSIVALIVSIVATMGSLYFSEIKGYVPCALCWYQRIFIYPLVIILLVELIRFKGVIQNVYTALCLSLIGFSISTYHMILQYGTPDSDTCGVGVSCTARYINWLDFITIPLLSFVAFILIIASLIVILVKTKKDVKK